MLANDLQIEDKYRAQLLPRSFSYKGPEKAAIIRSKAIRLRLKAVQSLVIDPSTNRQMQRVCQPADVDRRYLIAEDCYSLTIWQ